MAHISLHTTSPSSVDIPSANFVNLFYDGLWKYKKSNGDVVSFSSSGDLIVVSDDLASLPASGDYVDQFAFIKSGSNSQPSFATWNGASWDEHTVSGGSSTTTHIFSSQSTININHGLGYKPFVYIILSNGNQVYANTVSHSDDDNVSISFSTSLTGVAYMI